MWRSFFLAVGFTTLLIGAECLVVDKAVLRSRREGEVGSPGAAAVEGRPREFVPSDWTPWSLLSTGAIVMIYSFTIPQRVKG